MGFMHIENLYRPGAQKILLEPEVYALEKVHGTSAHISYSFPDGVTFFSGGENHERFVALFDRNALHDAFDDLLLKALFNGKVTIYGEAYGGKQQGMSHTYGPDLRFIAFDVKVDDRWLSVPEAERLVLQLGLEFVPYERVPTNLSALDFERDRPSRVAKRRGIVEDKVSEGIVIRPLEEKTVNNFRLIAKHKGDAFSERATPQKVVDPEKLQVLRNAIAIAEEWATPMRLEHVLQAVGRATGTVPTDMTSTPTVIKAMIEDVYREASGEIVESKEATAAIGKQTALLFKRYLNQQIQG